MLQKPVYYTEKIDQNNLLYTKKVHPQKLILLQDVLLVIVELEKIP